MIVNAIRVDVNTARAAARGALSDATVRRRQRCPTERRVFDHLAEQSDSDPGDYPGKQGRKTIANGPTPAALLTALRPHQEVDANRTATSHTPGSPLRPPLTTPAPHAQNCALVDAGAHRGSGCEKVTAAILPQRVRSL
jgi:hypothetical protein